MQISPLLGEKKRNYFPNDPIDIMCSDRVKTSIITFNRQALPHIYFKYRFSLIMYALIFHTELKHGRFSSNI